MVPITSLKAMMMRLSMRYISGSDSYKVEVSHGSGACIHSPEQLHGEARSVADKIVDSRKSSTALSPCGCMHRSGRSESRT